MPRFTARLAWRLMVIATVIWAASAAWAQGNWVKLAPFPEPAEEISGAEARGKMYVFAGLAPLWKPLGMVYDYNPASNRWAKKQKLALPSHHLAFTPPNTTFHPF